MSRCAQFLPQEMIDHFLHFLKPLWSGQHHEKFEKKPVTQKNKILHWDQLGLRVVIHQTQESNKLHRKQGVGLANIEQQGPDQPIVYVLMKGNSHLVQINFYCHNYPSERPWGC